MRWSVRGREALVSLLLAFAVYGTEARAQETIRVDSPAIRLGTGEAVLYEVQDAEFVGDDRIIVLTSSAPFLHLFDSETGRLITEWGREGRGPGELLNPTQLAVGAELIHVLDLVPGANRINRYSREAEFENDVRLPVQPDLVYGLATAEGGSLVETGDFRSGRRSLQWVGESLDKLLEIQSPAQVTLRAPNAAIPSLTIGQPYGSEADWALLETNVVVLWPGSGNVLDVLNPEGKSVGRLRLPEETLPVTMPDRELWLVQQMPPGGELFGVRDPYAELRERARETLHFPESYPPVLKLLPGQGAAVWVLRGHDKARPVWLRVHPKRPDLTILIPTGRQIMGLRKQRMIALARDADGVELIEVYEVPP